MKKAQALYPKVFDDPGVAGEYAASAAKKKQAIIYLHANYD